MLTSPRTNTTPTPSNSIFRHKQKRKVYRVLQFPSQHDSDTALEVILSGVRDAGGGELGMHLLNYYMGTMIEVRQAVW